MNIKYFIMIGSIIIAQATMVKPNDLAENAKKLHEELKTMEDVNWKEFYELQGRQKKEMQGLLNRHESMYDPYYSASKKLVEDNLPFIEEKILGQDCPAYLARHVKDLNRWFWETSLSKEEGNVLFAQIRNCCSLSNVVMPMLPTEERKAKIENFRKNAKKNGFQILGPDGVALLPESLAELAQDSKK
jgi:hypothetical protein